jgi:FAD synthase
VQMVSSSHSKSNQIRRHIFVSYGMKIPEMPSRKVHRLSPFIQIDGIVEHGFGRGSKALGFPTANLNSVSSSSVFSFLQSEACKDGIYIGWVKLPTFEGPFRAAISVGINPTFPDSTSRLVEAYLMDYSGPDFYDQHIRILICAHIRESLKFESIESLRDEIACDVEFAKNCFQSHPDLQAAKYDRFLLA